MLLKPNWPAPQNVHAYTTLRSGGASLPPYHTFNLAEHVGDQPLHVADNRRHLRTTLGLATEPIWIEQRHTNIVIQALPENRNKEADATFTDQAHQVCTILTADCLPILICNKQGTKVSAIHAGWRGIYADIIAAAINALQTAPEDLLVWFGPAIGPKHFEVKADMYEPYLQRHPDSSSAFQPHTAHSKLANIYKLAKIRFAALGIKNIYGGNECTYSDPERFYSYRRDQGNTGRMASLIWFT